MLEIFPIIPMIERMRAAFHSSSPLPGKVNPTIFENNIVLFLFSDKVSSVSRWNSWKAVTCRCVSRHLTAVSWAGTIWTLCFVSQPLFDARSGFCGEICRLWLEFRALCDPADPTDPCAPVNQQGLGPGWTILGLHPSPVASWATVLVQNCGVNTPECFGRAALLP